MEINLLFSDCIIKLIGSALTGFIKAVRTVLSAILDTVSAWIIQYNRIPSQVKHLAQHAKKARVRKKNRNRILREFKKLMNM